MTALQDWLSNSPVDPRAIKALICDTFKGQDAEQPVPPAQTTLLRPGLERC